MPAHTARWAPLLRCWPCIARVCAGGHVALTRYARIASLVSCVCKARKVWRLAALLVHWSAMLCPCPHTVQGGSSCRLWWWQPHIPPIGVVRCAHAKLSRPNAQALFPATAESAALDVFDSSGDTLLQLNGTAPPTAPSPAAAPPSRTLLAALPTFLDWRPPSSESLWAVLRCMPLL